MEYSTPGFPGPTHEEDCIPRRNSRIPPQLEKRHVVPPSSQDEALAPYSVSREVPRSVLKCETVLAPLMRPQKFLDAPEDLQTESETDLGPCFWGKVLPRLLRTHLHLSSIW